ncbi:hypothetical protein [Clostridioides difficile]
MQLKVYGAEVVLNGAVYDDAYAKAVEIQKEKGIMLKELHWEQK